jgi:glucokinase
MLASKPVRRTLALDIGGTNFSVGVFADEILIGRATQPTNRLAGPLWMLDRMQEMVAGMVTKPAFDACGIGFGGPVDFSTQRVLFSTQVPGWEGFDVIGEVQKRFAAPAIMDRDTMAGALGEGIYGVGKGFRPLFYITLSTGVGGGLLTENGLYRGVDSYACELGHQTVLSQGPECLCGSFGCLERMTSGLWLERDYGKTAQELFTDPEFVSGYVVNLAQGLKNTIMLLNPARIVIGGGISKAGDALFVPLRHELRRQVTSWSKARIDVVPASLGGDSVLWGALRLALEGIHR